jgi:hypothetical protein
MVTRRSFREQTGVDNRTPIFLIGEGDAWRTELFSSSPLVKTHKYVASPREAVAVFAWLPNVSPSPFICFQLGLAASVAPLFIAAPTSGVVESILEWVRPVQGSVARYSASSAYNYLLEDVDSKISNLYRSILAPTPGICTACGGSYEQNTAIRYAVAKGGMHVDCYMRRHDPQYADPAVFNSELVFALREQNAQLEDKVRKLEASVQGGA